MTENQFKLLCGVSNTMIEGVTTNLTSFSLLTKLIAHFFPLLENHRHATVIFYFAVAGQK